MTALSALEQLRRLLAEANDPDVTTIDDVDVAVAIRPAIRLLESVTLSPETPRKPVAMALSRDNVSVVLCDDGSYWLEDTDGRTWKEYYPIPGSLADQRRAIAAAVPGGIA